MEEINNVEPMFENGFEDSLSSEEREMLAEADNSQESTESSVLSAEEQALLDRTLAEVHNEIPLNSTSSLLHETTSRFSSAIWYKKIQEQTIILAGVGGIGSYVAFLLARMKPKKLFIYDDDSVETANMSGQLYGQSDIGQSKVSAISNMIKNYADFYEMCGITERYTINCEATNIMICGFDNMSARRTYYRNWANYVGTLDTENKKKCLFIDGRLAAEEFQIFAIQGTDQRAMRDYEHNWLFSDSAADPTICSYKQTTFCANMIASYMVNIFVNFIANQCNPLMERDVPYYTVYNAETMFFTTEA